MTESFILCIALGGFADLTTEIWACREYAIKHKRSLIIDKAHYKADRLDEIFDFTDWPIPVYFRDRIYSVIHTDIEPTKYRELLTYEGPLIKSFKISGECPSFDMNRSYKSETLLIHCSWRPGPNLADLFLRSVGFTLDFTRFLKTRMSGLPPNYNVSHIRHTDYTVDLEATYQYIDRLMTSSPLQLYVATDNTSVLKTLIERYGSSILYNSSVFELPDVDKAKTLHHSGRRFTLHNAILDLFILAGGGNSVVAQYKESGSKIGGYTQLAELLRSDTSFIDRLLV
jgi:hypothetical protein